MDGVLIDSMPLHINIFVKLTRNFSKGKIKKEVAKKIYLNTAGFTLSSQFKRLFKKESIPLTEKDNKKLVKEFFRIKEQRRISKN